MPFGEVEYFPPLEQCLSGEFLLIAWKDVFAHLVETPNPEVISCLFAFLRDKEATAVLVNATHGFPIPNAESRASFETKTAAINITPSPKGRYDIHEIKEDALWLSEEAKIDEVTALRIVILEWQYRPLSKLRSGFSDAEKASIREGFGNQSDVAMNRTNRNLQNLLSQEFAAEEFATKESRKVRLLDLYLLERYCLLNAARLLYLAACQDTTLQDESEYPLKKRSQRSRGEYISTRQEIGRHLHDLQLQRFEMHSPKMQSRSEQADLPEPQTTKERILVDHISSLVARHQNITNGSGWFRDQGGREEVEIAWCENNFKEMVVIMEILFLQARSSDSVATSPVILNWLHFLAGQSFFERIEATSPSILIALEALQLLAPLVTLAILNVQDSIQAIAENVNLPQERVQQEKCQFFVDSQNVGQIHYAFLNAASNSFKVTSVPILAWALICVTVNEAGRRSKEARESALDQHADDSARNSGGSFSLSQQSVFEDIMAVFRHVSGGEEYGGYLLRAALEYSNAFEEITALANRYSGASLDDRWKRLCLQELAGISVEVIGFSNDTTTALFSTLHEHHSEERALASYSDGQSDPWATFSRNHDLVVNGFDEAMLSFPFQALAFLQLCRLLASSNRNEEGVNYTYQRLITMTTFSYAVSPAFQGYQTIREDENANFVQLTESVNMYGLGPTKAIGFGNITTDAIGAKDLIPAGTEGQIISTSRPLVICFDFSYSGLAYLGKWLALIQSGKIAYDQQLEPLDNVKAEIVGLIATFVSAAKHYDSFIESPDVIIAEASDWLEGESDIVTIIAEVLEQELLSMSNRPSTGRSLDVLVACVDFFSSMIDVLPGRIWQILARSSLFESDSGSGVIQALVKTMELASSELRFLGKCVDLSMRIVEDVITRSIPTPSLNSKRFENRSSTRPTQTPYHTMDKVLCSMTQELIQIYDSMMAWTFRDLEQRANIDSKIVWIFRRVLYYAYGINETHGFSNKNLAVFAASASYILDSLMSLNSSDGLVNSIMISIGRSLDMLRSTIDLALNVAGKSQTSNTLSLCLEILRAAALKNHHATKSFREQVFNVAPILLRIYASDDSLRRPVVRLLTYLLQEMEKLSGFEAQSLLGQLGSGSSLSLVELLAYFDQPFEDPALAVDTWDLFTALINKNQQWFAVLVLTGSVSSIRPVDTTRDRTAIEVSTRGKAILQRALDTTAEVVNKDLDVRVVNAALKFIIVAQENWDKASTTCNSHEGYVKAIRDYPARIEPKASESELERCHLTKLAALIAQALNFYIYHVRATKDQQAAEKLERAITWYSENAPKVDGYRVSLHVNLKRNIKHIYPTCDLDQFKKTLLVRHEYGDSFYYDINIAGKMLGFHNAWSGTPKQGLRDEFSTANLNLSLVSAQMSLLHSWKTLVLEHAAFFAGWHRAHRILESAVSNCFKANSKDKLPAEHMFETLFQSRIDIAVALTQGLVAAKIKASEFTNLLDGAWLALNHRTVSYELAIATKDLEYHRSLLNVLLLTLQFHVRTPASRTSKENQHYLNILLNILTAVVAQGLTALVAAVHDQDPSTDAENLIGPADFRLLLALLQSTIRVPNLQVAGSTQASQALLAASISQSILRLYSWSHFLLAPNSDPVYAPLSASFLATLSSLPLVAEDLAATHSVLSSVLTARISRLLISRPYGAGPLDADILSQRLYDTWTRGILPLCLNLLQSVGRAVAAEVVHFLNNFPNQLERASLALNAKSRGPNFCLASIKEVQDLALITAILNRYREAGPSAGVDPLEMMDELRSWAKNDRKGIAEDVDDLLGTRSQIRIRILPIDERERTLARRVVEREKDDVVSALEETAVAELEKCLVVLNVVEQGD